MLVISSELISDFHEGIDKALAESVGSGAGTVERLRNTGQLILGIVSEHQP